MLQREALGAINRAASSAAIIAYLTRQISWSKYQTVHVFLSSEKLLEVDTWPLVRYLWQQQPHIKAVTNVMDKIAHELHCCHITETSEFVVTKMGVLEPKEIIPVQVDQIDLMIIPLLACDFKGNRLGFGKGFYDRLLAQCRQDMGRIGVNFFPPCVETIPVGSHDQAIDCLVMPEHVYRLKCYPRKSGDPLMVTPKL